MRKCYAKPLVDVLEFSVNEAIVSGCGMKVYNHTVASCSSDPTDEWNEMKWMTGATLTDDFNCEVPLDGYCYFTSHGTGTFLFNS